MLWPAQPPDYGIYPGALRGARPCHRPGEPTAATLLDPSIPNMKGKCRVGPLTTPNGFALAADTPAMRRNQYFARHEVYGPEHDRHYVQAVDRDVLALVPPVGQLMRQRPIRAGLFFKGFVEQGEPLHNRQIIRLHRGEVMRHLQEFRIVILKLRNNTPCETFGTELVDLRNEQVTRQSRYTRQRT